MPEKIEGLSISLSALTDDPSPCEDFITVVKIPGMSKPHYIVELRRWVHRVGDGEFAVTQCSEPLGKVEAGKLAKVWGKFHRLEVR